MRKIGIGGCNIRNSVPIGAIERWIINKLINSRGIQQ